MPKSFAAAAVALAALLVSACGTDGTAATRTGAEVAAVAGVYPLAWVAQRVAPDATVTSLSAGGLEAHDVEIDPGQRAAIAGADVVLFVGDVGYQPQLEQAVGSAEGHVVSLAEVAGPGRLLDSAEDGAAHGDESGATIDPHIWFDVEVMADVAEAAGEAFAAADPGNAVAYRASAAELAGELTDLGRELDVLLDGDCRHHEAVVSHQAYRYLLEPYGHVQHGVGGIDPEAGASIGELAELVERIERDQIDYILAEPVEGRADAETVAAEAGIELLEVSPLDAVTEEQAATGLVALIRHQALQFATALGC